jgi:hypothetical protein
MADFAAIINDTVALTDLAQVAREVPVTRSDTVAITDALARSLRFGRVANDTIALVDGISIQANQSLQLIDAIGVVDSLLSQPTIAFKIDEVRALTESKVRIDFERPALINDALMQPASYAFSNLSPASVEVTPLSVATPPGQANPLYVEITTTEHTDGGSYEVALSPSLRGAAGEVGYPVPSAYTGIGVAPTLQLVIAVSATEAEVHFSESIENNSSARDPDNYTWSGGISTVDVRSVDGSVVVLQTTAQEPGQLYTLTVHGIVPGVLYDIELFQDDLGFTDGLIAKRFAKYSVAIAEDDINVTDSVATVKTAGPVLSSFFAAGRPGPPSSPELQKSSNDSAWVSTNYSPAPNKIVRNAARNVATGTIILAGDAGLFLRSTDDGATWTLSTPFPVAGTINAVWFGNGKWVVSYSNASSSTGIYYSTDDGVTWSSFIDPDSGTGTGHSGTAPAGFSDVSYDAMWVPALSLHVAVGYRGNIWTSPDAITWTRRSPANVYVGSFYGFRGICYSPSLGLLCAVGDPNEIQTSPNGINWTKRTSDVSVTTFWDVCWSPTQALFVAVGEGSSGSSKIMTSPDGINWTLRTPAVGANNFYSCSWDSTNALFVVAGRFGKIQTSPNGIAWTSRSPANTGGNFIGDGSSSIFVIVGRGQGQ